MDIEIRNLTKYFGENLVLDHISTIFKDRKVNCILGESGCGKTTLLHIIMGIVKADSGSILGLEDRKVSAIFQEDRLCESLTLLKNIRLVCDNKISNDAISKHIAQVGLKDYLHEPIDKLSGGMKRRVSIVRAILYPCDTIIMDEPFKGLDDATKLAVTEYIKKYTVDKTLIVVTHDQRDIYQLGADHILTLT